MLQGKVNSSILHTKEPRWGSLLRLGEASLSRTLSGPHFSWESAVTNMTKTLKYKCRLPSCSLSALTDSECSYFGTNVHSPINLLNSKNLSAGPEIHSPNNGKMYFVWLITAMWLLLVQNQLNISYHITTYTLAALYPRISGAFVLLPAWNV